VASVVVQVSSVYSLVLVFVPQVVDVGGVSAARKNGVAFLGDLFQVQETQIVQRCHEEEAIVSFFVVEIFESLFAVGKLAD
jgi:hypothetical protein